MFCKNCGYQLEDGSKFCEKCGTPTSGRQEAPAQPARAEKRGEICCPDCGSFDLQIINENTLRMQADFSATGGSVSATSENVNCFVCTRCGKKFKNPKDLRENATKKYRKDLTFLFGFLGGLFGFLAVIFAILTEEILAALIVLLAFGLSVGVILPFAILKRNRQYREAQAIEDAIKARMAQMEK